MANDDIAQFVKRATRVTSLNLVQRDVEVLTYKQKIRELISDHISPGIDWNQATTNIITKEEINKKINHIRTNANLDVLYNYKLKGPGEFLLFLIINDAVLMPDKQGEVDMTIGGAEYQVKSYRTSDDYVKDLRLSGFEISDIASKLMALKELVGLPKTGGVTKSEIDKIKRVKLTEFESIQKQYREMIYEEYFKSVTFMFLDSPSKSVKAIRNVQEKDITIQRYESGTIRPTIKISDTQTIE